MNPWGAEGPRPQLTRQGIDGLARQEAQAPFKKGTWPEARQFFQKMVKEHPESWLVPSALAFLTEISLRAEASNRGRSDVIKTYRKTIREYAQSQNVRRAEWRIADMHLEQGMAHSVPLPFDGNRLLLGIGCVFMVIRK